MEQNNKTDKLLEVMIADIENILDQVIFIQNGQIRLSSSVDDIRAEEGKSVDALFREVFRC